MGLGIIGLLIGIVKEPNGLWIGSLTGVVLGAIIGVLGITVYCVYKCFQQGRYSTMN